jgi:hypothetical protein
MAGFGGNERRGLDSRDRPLATVRDFPIDLRLHIAHRSFGVGGLLRQVPRRKLLREGQSAHGKANRFLLAVRVGDVAIFVQAIHRRKVDALPDSAFLKLKCAKQRQYDLINLRSAAGHDRT